MRRVLRLSASILLLVGLVVFPALRAKGHDAIDVCPPGAIAGIELRGLAPAITALEHSELRSAIESSPAFRKWRDSADGRKAAGGVTLIESQLEDSAWSILRNLFGDQVAVAIYPPASSAKPEGVMVARLADAATLASYVEKLQPLIDLAGNRVQRSERKDGGVELVIDNRMTLAYRGCWYVASENRGLIDTVFSRIDSEAELKSKTPHRLFDATSSAGAWIDLAAIRKLMGTLPVPQKLDNPLASLLFGGLARSIKDADAVSATVAISDRQLDAKVTVASPIRSQEAPFTAYLAPADGSRNASLPPVAGLLAGVTVYRDFGDWYRGREQLVEERVLPEFDKFETGLSTFLIGRDFGADVLPLLGRRVSLLAAPQTFEHLGAARPGVQLPAFGVVLELDHPEEGADLIRLFFQTLVAVTNLEAGKQGRQPWILTSQVHRDVTLSYARYLETPSGDSLPIVFNFQPSSALVGKYFVLSSSREFCQRLIDAVLDWPSPKASPPRNLSLTFDPAVAAKLLNDNAAALHANNVLQGQSIQQSEEQLTLLVNWLKQFRPLDWKTELGERGFDMSFSLGW
ncbi:MAG: hypothetical protein KF777_14665 [Planctomycetaceae bacterium]|nr:hypothetical protein [Planctomycetaceae bacterium]